MSCSDGWCFQFSKWLYQYTQKNLLTYAANSTLRTDSSYDGGLCFSTSWHSSSFHIKWVLKYKPDKFTGEMNPNLPLSAVCTFITYNSITLQHRLITNHQTSFPLLLCQSMVDINNFMVNINRSTQLQLRT